MHSLDAHLAELYRTLNDYVFSCAPIHLAQCPPGRALRILSDSVLPSELTAEFFPFMHSLHLLNAHLVELHRTPQNDYVFFKLSAEFFLKCTLCHMLNAHLAELHRILNDSVCNCVLIHSLASKVFNNLEVFFS
jgi:hypothetical protein